MVTTVSLGSLTSPAYALPHGSKTNADQKSPPCSLSYTRATRRAAIEAGNPNHCTSTGLTRDFPFEFHFWTVLHAEAGVKRISPLWAFGKAHWRPRTHQFSSTGVMSVCSGGTCLPLASPAADLGSVSVMRSPLLPAARAGG
jgi:hypothetical protein